MERWEGAGGSGARPFAEGRAPVGESAPLWGRARPSGVGRALVAYLIGRGLNSSTYIDYLIGRGFGDFLLFFDAAKS